MRKQIVCGVVCMAAILSGCTFNVTEEIKAVTLSASSVGLSEISVKKNLLEDSDIAIVGIDEKVITVTAVASMLVLNDGDDDLDKLQLSISSGGSIGYSYLGNDWSRIKIDNMSLRIDRSLDCDLESISGKIKVKDMISSLSLETISGDIEVTLDSDTLPDTLNCTVETVSGDVEINVDPDILISAKTVYTISIETTSGDIIITVPELFEADLTWSTKSGDKETSSFIDNSGAKHTITCKTTSGDLTIEGYSL